MNFTGIDPSLTGTGIVTIDNDNKILTQKLISTSTKDSIEKRLAYILSVIKTSINTVDNFVCLEGLSFQSRGRSLTELAGLHYLIRDWLLNFMDQWKFNYKVITPSTLKKFVTGSGRAKKDLILLSVYKKWNTEFNDHNLADAFSLAQYAKMLYHKKGKK